MSMENLSPEETKKHKINLYIGIFFIMIITGLIFSFFILKAHAETGDVLSHPCVSGCSSPLYGQYWGSVYLTSTGAYGNYDGQINQAITQITVWLKDVVHTEGQYPTEWGIGIDQSVPFSDGNSYCHFTVPSASLHTGENVIDVPPNTHCEIPDNSHPYMLSIKPSNTPSYYVTAMTDSTYTYSFFELTHSSMPANTNYSTRIEWVNPPKQTPSATTTSQTINFSFNYYINSATTTPENLSHIQLSLCPLSYPEEDCQKEEITASTTWDTWTNVSSSITTDHVGFYLGMVYFWNGVETATNCNWWEFWCTEEHPVVSYTNSNKFNVATTSIPVILPIDKEAIMSSCEDQNFAGEAICKTMLWLFYPSEDAFSQFQNLGQQMGTKIPFSYFYQVKTELENVSQTQSSQGSNIQYEMFGHEITLIDWSAMHTYYNTLFHETGAETYFIYGAWIVFALWAFYRVADTLTA